MTESEPAKWLKTRYGSGPLTKKVKFSRIHDELAAHFAATRFNSLAVSQAIKEAFPNTESKPHGSILNVTSRLAIRLQNLPDWNVDWADLQAQRSRHSLIILSFRLEYARHLKERATAFLMRFLAEKFDSLSDLKRFVPEQQSPLYCVVLLAELRDETRFSSQ